MNFPFKSLLQLIPPPLSPVENQGNWRDVETRLGTILPADYKWFIETYGTGWICHDFLFVLNAFTKDDSLNLQACGERILQPYRMIEGQPANEYNPNPVYPESGGILPWGFSSHGHETLWLTRGDPDTWSVVFHDADRLESRLYENTCMTQFLVTLLSETIDGGEFQIPKRDLQYRPRFEVRCQT